MTSSGNKVLILIIAVLLISNLTLVAFITFGGKPGGRPPRSRGEAFSGFIKKELNFSEDQAAKFEELMSGHFEKLKPVMGEIRKAKDSMFLLMRQPAPPSDSLLEIAAENIAEKQKLHELYTFSHFRQVRELCTEEQKPKFDSLITRMINRSSGRFSDHGKKDRGNN